MVRRGEVPPLPLDRDRIHIISQGVADPVYIYDVVPLTYTERRWMCVVEADEAALKQLFLILLSFMILSRVLVRYSQKHNVRTLYGVWYNSFFKVKGSDGQVWKVDTILICIYLTTHKISRVESLSGSENVAFGTDKR